MTEFTEISNEENIIGNLDEHTNSLTFDDKVIKKIVGFAACEIPGILAMSGNLLAGLTDMLKSSDDPTKGISVEVGKKQVAIDMKVICEYGRNIPEIFGQVIDRATSAINEMTGLDVVELNVHVVDVLSKDEFSRKKGADSGPKPDEALLLNEAPRVE